jgi:hypothetical protein
MGPLCMLRFFLDDGRMVMAHGPWTAHRAPRWQGAILQLPDAIRAANLRSANGVVNGDGTVECRTRCDATAPATTGSAPPVARGTTHVPPPCSLVTAAEVEAALGVRPRHRTPLPGNEGSVCTWHQKPLATLTDIVLSLQVTRMTREQFEQALSRSTTARPIEGLGEPAYVFDDGRLLTVWAKGYALTVTNRTDRPLETGTRIAAAALARL